MGPQMKQPTEEIERQEAEADKSQTPSGSFAEFELDPGLMQGIGDLGYQGPTPVQRETLQPVLQGRDVIVQSKTGSGKTSAFGIPIVARLQKPGKDVRALALCPTRELAIQVSREISALAKHCDLSVLPIYGGAAFGPQLDALDRGVDIVVGTPGRVLDHMRRGTLRLRQVEFMVLDEADEMLSMGFWDEVTSVLGALRHPHQTMLFSATLPSAIERAASHYLNEPERIELSGDELTVSSIANVYYLANEQMPKPRNMLYVLETEQPESAIVFCNRKDETELVTNVLRRFGFTVGLLNSDLSQRERERVMGRFKSGELRILVATDVAARGIDIFDLSHVFHYDLPDHIEVYVHRAGRTGRVGKSGRSVALIRGLSTTRLREISRHYDIEFEKTTLPEAEVIVAQQTERILSQLAQEADGVETSQYQAIAQALLEHDKGSEAIAFLLRSYFADSAKQPTAESGGRGMAPRRLEVDAGTEDGLDQDSLRKILAEAANLDPELIMHISLRSTMSTVEVGGETAHTLLEPALEMFLEDGKPLRIRSALNKPGRGRGQASRGRPQGRPRSPRRGRR